MASDEVTEFSFGEEVVISATAAPRYRPGSRGWIVALALPERALVTVEFEDGSSLEVPPDLINKSSKAHE